MLSQALSHPLQPRALPLLVTLTWLVLGAACQVDNTQQCEDLDEILRARADDLPNDCTRDSDCLIVEVRPGVAAVTTTPFDSAEVAELQATYRRDCGEFDTRYQNPSATCQDEAAERRCVLRVDHLITPPDSADLADADDDLACECNADGDCPAEAPTCDGACICRDNCGVACRSADECGLLNQLGLGQSADDCTARCNAFAEASRASADSLVECLSEATCDAMSGCN